MTEFPYHHYPQSDPPYGLLRDIFREYGKFGGTDFCEDSCTWQSQMSRSEERLQAEIPTLPLIPPNDVFTFGDVCMDEIKGNFSKLKQELKSANLLRHHKKVSFKKQDLKYTKKIDIQGELEKDDIDTFIDGHAQFLPHSKIRSSNGVNRFYARERMKQLLTSKTFLKMKSFHKVNPHYTGGCLSCLPSINNTHDTTVIYPSGPELSNLCMRQVTHGDAPFCTAGKVSFEKDMGCPIYGVQATRCQNRDFIGVRCPQRSLLYEVGYAEDGARPLDICQVESEDDIFSFIPSPYLPGEVLLATSGRKVSIFNSNRSISVVDHVKPRLTCPDPWLQAHYGSTPRSIVVTDRTCTQLVDIRCSKSRSFDLLALPNPSLYKKERIMVSAPCGTNFYHLVATDYALLLLDERFPGEPVMLWRHSLHSLPQYLDFIPDVSLNESKDVVCLGTQDSCEVVCYPLSLGREGKQMPHSLGPPWRISRIDDFPQFCGTAVNGINSSVLDQRLSKTSLIGVSTVPASNRNGFTTFQLSSYGDLFYQTYTQGHLDEDRTCSAGIGSSDLTFTEEFHVKCREWMGQLIEVFDNHATEIDENISHRKVDLTELSAATKTSAYPHMHCYLCMHGSRDKQTDVVTFDRDTDCMVCGCGLEMSERLKDYVEKGPAGLISIKEYNSRLLDRVPDLDASKFTDPYSQLLLKEWNDDEEDIQELLLERDKWNEDLKKQTIERKRQRWQEKNKALVVPASPRSRAGTEVSLGGSDRRTIRSSSSRARTEVSPNGSDRRTIRSSSERSVRSDRSRLSQTVGTFRDMKSILENTTKNLLEYDQTSTKGKEANIAGFGSMPRSPLRRARSTDSLFSNVTTPSHFLGASKGIDDCVKRIIEFDSDVDNDDEQIQRNVTIQNWISAVEPLDASTSAFVANLKSIGSPVKKGENPSMNACDVESRTSAQLEDIGLSVRTMSRVYAQKKAHSIDSPRKLLGSPRNGLHSVKNAGSGDHRGMSQGSARFQMVDSPRKLLGSPRKGLHSVRKAGSGDHRGMSGGSDGFQMVDSPRKLLGSPRKGTAGSGDHRGMSQGSAGFQMIDSPKKLLGSPRKVLDSFIKAGSGDYRGMSQGSAGFQMVGESFDHLSLVSASLFSDHGSDRGSITPAHSGSKQINGVKTTEHQDDDVLHFSQESGKRLFPQLSQSQSQSGFKLPRSPAKSGLKRKKNLVVGF